ncbi:hypothetical protein [Mycolicibacterium sp. YH-1]|uniref:hypothetical protein n=1 Tax=Mycolicibacterium sp. YH-1 TaxID=2908837 RepID=UPI002112DAE4|nr:hypothetical protein [Mycolicibacterium sp. YH-1]
MAEAMELAVAVAVEPLTAAAAASPAAEAVVVAPTAAEAAVVVVALPGVGAEVALRAAAEVDRRVAGIPAADPQPADGPRVAAVCAGSARSGVRAVRDAESVASQGQAAAESPCRANQAGRGPAAASSPLRFCLKNITDRRNRS